MGSKRSVICSLLLVLVVALAGCTGSSNEPEPEGNDGENVVPEDRSDRYSSNDRDLSIEGATETTMSAPYTGGLPSPNPVNSGCSPPFHEPGGPENIAGACFTLPEHTVQIDIVLEDDTGNRIGAYWALLDEGYGHLDTEWFCGAYQLIPHPQAVHIQVTVQDPAGGMSVCAPDVSTPTTGTLKAVFLHHA